MRRVQKDNRKSNYIHRTLLYWIDGLLWAVLAWWFLLPPAPRTIEYWFSRRWYRWMLDFMTPLTQSARFPIAIVLLFVGCIIFGFFWARSWILIRRIQGRPHWTGFLWGIRCMFLILPVLVIWFLAFWGAGYHRLPVEERLHLDTSAISDSDMNGLRDRLLEEIKRNVLPPLGREPGRAVTSISLAMARIVAGWDGCSINLPGRVKLTPKGLLLSNGSSGVCAPFTLEALVDKALPDTALVYSAAHELGHVAGFCLEDEASFAGYFSGLQAEDGFARYACALGAYFDLISDLKGEDFVRAFEALPEPAKQDLKRTDEAYRKYRLAWFSRVSWRAYNKYLQAQGVREGVRNYSHGITLLGYAWRNGLVKPAKPDSP
jgi:hypothetical protein